MRIGGPEFRQIQPITPGGESHRMGSDTQEEAAEQPQPEEQAQAEIPQFEPSRPAVSPRPPQIDMTQLRLTPAAAQLQWETMRKAQSQQAEGEEVDHVA